jgi:Xaa-Pro aminopeptidase
MESETRKPVGPPPAFPAEEFYSRRQRVVDAIGPGALAVVQGAGPVQGFVAFRQNNDFHYLCGVEVPQAYLVLDGGTGKSSLFVHPSGVSDATRALPASGVDRVLPLDELGVTLGSARSIYVPHSPAEGSCESRDVLTYARAKAAEDPWDAPTPRHERFVARLRETATSGEVLDLSPILDEMRLLKSPRELESMRWAGLLSGAAVLEAMRSTRPGLHEYQLAAVADYVFREHGPRGGAYHHIVPTGDNIWDAHYAAMNDVLVDGELVLMDCAPDVGNYTSDIGRMWPVNGRYNTQQRELYGFIVEYHKAVLGQIGPGRMPRDVLAAAADEMRPVVDKTPWSGPAYEAAARACLTFKGHLSHPVGMAVHDVGRYFDRPMEPGLVITVDPQMWVQEEQLYVRVEDTIAVTDTGIEVLTSLAPLELDDVEQVVGMGGILQDHPPLTHKEYA